MTIDIPHNASPDPIWGIYLNEMASAHETIVYTAQFTISLEFTQSL